MPKSTLMAVEQWWGPAPAIVAASKDTSDFDGSIRKGSPSNTAAAAIRAVKAIDPDSMPRLAETMLPSLMKPEE